MTLDEVVQNPEEHLEKMLKRIKEINEKDGYDWSTSAASEYTQAERYAKHYGISIPESYANLRKEIYDNIVWKGIRKARERERKEDYIGAQRYLKEVKIFAGKGELDLPEEYYSLERRLKEAQK